MFLKNAVPALAVALVLAGCQSAPKKPAATLDALLDTQVAEGGGSLPASSAGAMIGSVVGRGMNASLDGDDQTHLTQAWTRAYSAPVGERITWTNAKTGNSGLVIPTRDGYNSAGYFCREFQQSTTVGGQTQLAYGTACKQPDGTWKIVAKQ